MKFVAEEQKNGVSFPFSMAYSIGYHIAAQNSQLTLASIIPHLQFSSDQNLEVRKAWERG